MLTSPLAFGSNRLVQNLVWSKKATSGKCSLPLATNKIIHLSLIIMFHKRYGMSSTSFYGMQNRTSEFSVSLTEDFRCKHAK